MNALHPLGQLFQSVEDSRGWSLREIARRIERSGRSMSHAYVGRLKIKPITSITAETIAALAIGLDVPERVVGIAALESMGVHDVDPAEAGTVASITRDPDLTDRDRRILLAVVREMQRGQDDEHDDVGERAAAGGRGVARDAERDGVTAGDEAGALVPEPFTKADVDLAADTGRSQREPMDAEARRRGEESQDPEDWNDA